MNWTEIDRNNPPEEKVLCTNLEEGTYGYDEKLFGIVSENDNEVLICIDGEGELEGITHYIDIDQNIKEINESNLTDRFFLEEIIKRLVDANEWEIISEYAYQLLNDWMSEMITKNPLTEEQRTEIVKEFQGQEWQEYYFKSEVELKKILEKQNNE
ncbi:MAG: hypothetical protein JKY96_00135 [Phycisphaerales bacterium]|nr:hypothetical protein [Phycisphaerales bacterium]